MNLHVDALRFGELSTSYRLAVELAGRNSKEAVEIYNTIKELVCFNAERLAMTFRVVLHKQSSGIDKGVGIPLIANSVNAIINKGIYLKKRDLTTLNTRKDKLLHGINLMLDYSGSMWFEGEDETISNLQRIYAQNFLALVLGVYIQKISRGKLILVYNCFCSTNIKTVTTDLLNTDWDIFLLHSSWGSGTNLAFRDKLKPERLRLVATDGSWFSNENIREAMIEGSNTFLGKKLTDFVSIIMTDGGCHRLGESPEDRMTFLKKVMFEVSGNAMNFCYLISEQTKSFRVLCQELKIKYSVVNKREDYDKAFDYLVHLINTIGRH